MKNKSVAQEKPKRRRQPRLEPITYDELLSNAGMSGFVSFLDLLPTTAPNILPPDPVKDIDTVKDIGTVQISSIAIPPAARFRLYQLNCARDGHSLAEQAVYDALWNIVPSENETSTSRLVRIGYDRLAQITRLSWVSVKANLRSLERKLALETVAEANSMTRTGKTYRVYSDSTVHERRQSAGYRWARKTRGVELLKISAPQ